MNIKGTLLKFDAKNACHPTISKNCRIDMLEVMPIVKDFNFNDPNAIIGWCQVKRDDNGLTIFGTLNHGVSDIEVGTGLGGYFTKVISTFDGGVRTIESMSLMACSITDHPANDDYRITEVIENANNQ